jgi:hypothetical protein
MILQEVHNWAQTQRSPIDLHNPFGRTFSQSLLDVFAGIFVNDSETLGCALNK